MRKAGDGDRKLTGAVDGVEAQRWGVVAFLFWEAASKLKEAPGPTQWEWERVSSPVHGEW
jgi:hypothetical protein